MEKKLKHLEFLQNVITRMNTNSFLIKGWTITLVAALFALAAKDSDKNFIIICLFPTLIFWLLDTYYLKQEKLFRCLYSKVIKIDEEKIDFSMVTSNGNVSFLKTFFSTSLIYFYLSIFIIISGIFIYLNCWKGNCYATPTCFLEF